jgi:hypothetical protein
MTVALHSENYKMEKQVIPEKLTHPEDDFENPRWWWRRLVFTEFVCPKAPFSIATENAFETIAPSRDYIEKLILPGVYSPELLSVALTMFDEWKKSGERVAYRYELLKRTLQHDYPSEELPAWPELGLTDLAWYKGALETDPRATRKLEHPPSKDPTYSDPIPWRWDLTKTDNALIQDFLGMILEEKKKKGLVDKYLFYGKHKGKLTLKSISKVSSRTAGKRNSRRVKWQVIELLDKASSGSLDDQEKDQVRKARERTESEFRSSILAAFENSNNELILPGVDQEANKDSNPLRMWLAENFSQHSKVVPM